MIKRVFVSTIALASLAFSSPSFAQNIDAAIEAAIKSEPRFLALSLDAEMQKSRLKMAKADAKPSLGLQGSYGASDSDFGAGYKMIYPRNLAIAWEMRLYDGGQSLAKISAEDFALAAANGEIVNSRNQLIAETAQAYSDYYVAQKSIEFAKDNVEANARYARDAKLQFDAGETAVSEKAFADASFARANAMYAQIIGQKDVAAANLYRLTAQDFANPSIDNANVQIPASLEIAKANAKANHPLLAAAKARLGQADAQYRLANGAYRPKVSVSARASSVRDQFLSGYRADDIGAYVNFSMPLYSYGRISSGVDMARTGKLQAELALRASERAIDMGITQAYSGLSTALAQKNAALAALDASNIAMKSVEAEMRVGQRPLKDVLEARRDLTQAKVEYAKAEAAIVVAKYRIYAAYGAN